MPYTLALLITFLLTALLTGLIWTVQLVHYPSFLNVGSDSLSQYESLHRKRIFPLVGPLMVAELIATGYLTFTQLTNNYHILAALLLLPIWLHTWFFAAPAHFLLSKFGYDEKVIRRLVSSNWIRTLAWTIRLTIYFALVYTLMSDYPQGVT
ncbi:hypothetical protein AB9P05_10790 [Roseivirga sp. BDSF3-8]|uniref:hypothetical protein n=1 Tax=Roseivirga sp. BDSF3-8 TaxID=3241598 RepID=UPI0035320AA6